MKHPLQSYDSLALFCAIAQYESYAAAAANVHLTKGALSYRISKLERELDLTLFSRSARGIELTTAGKRLLETCNRAFTDIRGTVDILQVKERINITIGSSTYFASRWLSPRLTNFTHTHSAIGLRLQPTLGNESLDGSGVDLTIRWGDGKWSDVQIESLFTDPAIPTARADYIQKVEKEGLEHVLNTSVLLHDCDGSSAWREWYEVAGFDYPDRSSDLVIADPNVRVQALIDGQGIALNDSLIRAEILSGCLQPLSSIALERYGYYLAYPKLSLSEPAVCDLCEWLKLEANLYVDQGHGMSY